MDPLITLKNTLKTNGQSLTKPRLIVFEALVQHDAMTMAELVAACPQLDRASVYRTIKLFETLEIIQRLHIGWKYKIELSHAYQPHHHHMACLKCGRTIVLQEDAAIEAQLLAIAERHGFTLTDHQLEMRGFCNQCQTANIA